MLGNSTVNGVGTFGTDFIRGLAMNGTTNLFIGGNFHTVGNESLSANGVVSWDGSNWNILGTNSTNNGITGGNGMGINALAMNGSHTLFVGGSFTLVGGSVSVNNIASWDGSNWNFLGTNSTENGVLGGEVFVLAMNGTSNLFVGGMFRTVGGNSITANNIASWDGSNWNILGTNSTNNGVSGLSSAVTALAMNGTDPPTKVKLPPTNKV